MAQINAGPIVQPNLVDPNVGLDKQFDREQKERISLRELKERRKTNEADIAIRKDQLELNKKKQSVDEMGAVLEAASNFRDLGNPEAAQALLAANADTFNIADKSRGGTIDFSNLKDNSQFLNTAMDFARNFDLSTATAEQKAKVEDYTKFLIEYSGPGEKYYNAIGVDLQERATASKVEAKDTRSTKEKGFATIAKIGIEAFKKKTNEYEAFKQAKGDQRFKDQLAAQLMQAELQYIDDPDKAKLKVDAILREIFGDTSGTEEISIDELR